MYKLTEEQTDVKKSEVVITCIICEMFSSLVMLKQIWNHSHLKLALLAHKAFQWGTMPKGVPKILQVKVESSSFIKQI